MGYTDLHPEVKIKFCFGMMPKFALTVQIESSVRQRNNGTIKHNNAVFIVFAEVGSEDVISPDHTVSSCRSQKCGTSGQLFCSVFALCFNLRNTLSFLSDCFLFTDHFPSWL